MRIIHSGLSKTATTTLQRYTFPRLQEFGLIGDYNPPALLSTLKLINRGYFSEHDVLEVRRDIEGNTVYYSALLKDGGVRVLTGRQPDLPANPISRQVDLHSI